MRPLKIGFAFSTKDRVDFTQRSLASIDACTGFDLVWVDGSDTPEGKALPDSAKPRNCRIVEVHRNVKGGPDAAICFGLRRLLQRGYDYCGLIENDIWFKPGWFPKLMELFELGKQDGLEVGAVTARSIESRVLIHRPGYVVKWNVGAGMVLFTREAAQMVLANYGADTESELVQYYWRKFALDLRNVWEFRLAAPHLLNYGSDWTYAKSLYKHGLSSLGTAPSLAFNMDMDVEKVFRTSYVNASPPVTEEDGRRFSCLLKELSRTRGSSRRRRKASMIWYALVDKFMGSRMHQRRVRRLTHPFNSAKVVLGQSMRKKDMMEVVKRLIPFPVKQKVRDYLASRNKVRLFGALAPLVPGVEDMFDGPPSLEEFKHNGEEFLRIYKGICGLGPDEKMLDVGCGIGRKTLPLTQYLSERAVYEGIDVTKAGIDWCREKITPRFSNFHFQQIDVCNKHYNPRGKYQPSEYEFPFADESFSFVMLGSVFTHMLPDDLENYLSEIYRVLKRGGRCLITFFLLNEESSRLIGTGDSTLDFKYLFDKYRTISRELPEQAIAFDERWIRDLYRKLGLNVIRLDYGSWCARENYLSYQDMILAAKE